MTSCPCGSGKAFDDCCAPYISGTPAPTAEALMRSRYSAFVRGDLDYVERTHSKKANEDFDPAELREMAETVKWVGLEILNTDGGGEGDETGTVEFVARFKSGKDTQVHHELSFFVREGGNWAYDDGKFNPKPPQRIVDKVGRNDPCPCGSGKKYKKCCGA